MLSGLNSSLLSYLSTQNLDNASTAANAGTAGTSTRGQASAAISQQALQQAAGTAKSAKAVQSLEAGQKALSTELRAAMAKAGVTLTGTVEFTVKNDGSVGIKGSDADKTATQAFLKADSSQPSFASRIAGQARDALKLSATIQQSAAISQAAKLAKGSSGVMSLYTSLMQQSAGTAAVFSVSSASSSLTYPGSLATKA
ncbi:hypothetical protein [Pelomonas cellulosilytica]|uniref:Flagellar hook-associated protein 2 C-terminal domain-containing protein n=1 Tax=Pelomonas cellulosilytica TaxID=2906762 RepID=A0ABS8XMU2_9BURK|nr:hypothetical protein [Pelomonas sp. P8]MCE4552952.1 hypothetical protein [Pelomonas sp. P8]